MPAIPMVGPFVVPSSSTPVASTRTARPPEPQIPSTSSSDIRATAAQRRLQQPTIPQPSISQPSIPRANNGHSVIAAPTEPVIPPPSTASTVQNPSVSMTDDQFIAYFRQQVSQPRPCESCKNPLTSFQLAQQVSLPPNCL